MAIINGRGRVGIRRSGTVAAASYLLDTYSGSAVAYSLRKLSLTYSGSAIRVRRSQDNAEQNIGFDASGNLDTTALTSFVGAGNGFVTTWYDQSGVSKNATQASATMQPKIVSSGSILTVGGKPSIKFDGVDDYLDCGLINNGTKPSDFSQLIVAKFATLSYNQCLMASQNGSNDGGYLSLLTRNGRLDKLEAIVGNPPNYKIMYTEDSILNDTQYLFEQFYTSNLSPYKSTILWNGSIKTVNDWLGSGMSNGGTEQRTSIGRPGTVGSYYYGGYIQEVIVYTSNKISYRASLESNINSHYSIYNTVFPEWSLNNVGGEQFLSALRNDVKSFNTGSIETISNALFNGSYICSILGTNGKIYYIPYSANNILVFDPATNAVTTISVISGSAKWCGAALAPNGKIYAVPLNAAKVLILDIATSAVSYINSVGTGNYDWYGAVLAPNGKIYGLPYNNQNVLVVNTDTNTTSTINTGIAGTAKWEGGVLAGNGKIYCKPNVNTGILVVDTNANTTSTFGSFTSGGNKWINLVLAPNGKIYGIPYSSRHIIVIDPSNNSSVLIDTTITSTYKWSEGVLAPNGKIYAMPSTLTDSLLEIDPDTNSFNNITISGLGSGYASPKLAANGKIYFRNGSGTKVVSIGDSQTMNINRVLSRYVNLY